MHNLDQLKARAAEAALERLGDHTIIGVGTGSTVRFFIDKLAQIKSRIEGAVASSVATESLLRSHGIPILSLNAVSSLPIYVDGADMVNARGEMLKGGGGALTREKIIATVASQVICMVDETKWCSRLNTAPVVIEVLPMARSFVARELVKLGGSPIYRDGFITDNGNQILDVFNLNLTAPHALELTINAIPGVIENGIFSARRADIVLVSSKAVMNEYRCQDD